MVRYKFTKDTTVWLTSDLHLGHDREFVWKSRGFSSVHEMNEILVQRFNDMVQPDDIVFILGDLTLGALEDSIEYLEALNGNIHVIAGNHDTDARLEFYEKLGWVVMPAAYMKWGRYSFFLSHYPMLTENFNDKCLKQCILNLHGHTHQADPMVDNYMRYHVGVDSHCGYPVCTAEIIDRMKAKAKELYV